MSARILVVEDEEKLARFVELELVHEGYVVTKSGNGRDALVCPYLYCPNCGTEMGGVYKAKHARADA